MGIVTASFKPIYFYVLLDLTPFYVIFSAQVIGTEKSEGE
jgi:hypothetical protein